MKSKISSHPETGRRQLSRQLTCRALILLILPWFTAGCETTPGSGPGPATVAMPKPTNDAESRFIGDISSALRSRGWDPQPVAKASDAGQRVNFSIQPAAAGFSSRIELRTSTGQLLASGFADSDHLPGAIGDVALVFDDSLAAFQRSLARVPLPDAP